MCAVGECYIPVIQDRQPINSKIDAWPNDLHNSDPDYTDAFSFENATISLRFHLLST